MKFDLDLKALAPWVAAFGVTPGTGIKTPRGTVAAEDLTVGDMLCTRDDGDLPITDIRLAYAAPAERDHYPVCISQGALGFGLPYGPLKLGPQHRVLFEHIRIPLLFGEDAVLVRAKSLCLSHDRISIAPSPVPECYIQITLARQAIIFAEGVPIESVLNDGECDLGYMTVRSWELMAAVA